MNSQKAVAGLSVVLVVLVGGGFWLSQNHGPSTLPHTENAQEAFGFLGQKTDEAANTLQEKATDLHNEAKHIGDKANEIKTSAQQVASDTKQNIENTVDQTTAATHNIQQKAERLASLPGAISKVVHDRTTDTPVAAVTSITPPNLGLGWKIVGLRPGQTNQWTVLNVKTGKHYIVSVQTTGTVKKTTLTDSVTGKVVKEFSTAVQ